ncbi:hypothetical protein [Kineococcus sp. SYSU DK006]|uniref:hypothetical protein n=1 Tax=Kineococcus sp. SYSU DK006 TaxID=3383127 RepID=UPI003D7E4A25
MRFEDAGKAAVRGGTGGAGPHHGLPAMSSDLHEAPLEGVRLLPTDPRDMVPSAVRWARAVIATIRTIPRAQLPSPSRTSLQAVVWVLAAAADYENRIPADHTAAMLAREAGVGDRVWQKRTAWLRERGWLIHGPGGQSDGWQLSTP